MCWKDLEGEENSSPTHPAAGSLITLPSSTGCRVRSSKGRAGVQDLDFDCQEARLDSRTQKEWGTGEGQLVPYMIRRLTEIQEAATA